MFQKKTFKWFSLLFLALFLTIGCVSAAENTTTCELKINATLDFVPCAVQGSQKLLESHNISYNTPKLKNCICQNSKTCNANILTIRQCLEKQGLKTYAEKVNKNQLKNGDIIHLKFNRTGHYEYYIKNQTNLKGFTGHIITPNKIKHKKTIPPRIQKTIKGQIAPVAIVLACLENPICEKMLEETLLHAGLSVMWCVDHKVACGKYVDRVAGAISTGEQKLTSELKNRNKVLVSNKKRK